MEYILTFTEGILSFLSPCMLPMLPLYVSYFAGGREKKKGVLLPAVGFILGFTLVFCLLGIFAGTLGRLLSRYHRAVEIVCGLIVVLFGLSYLGIVPLRFFRGSAAAHEAGSFLSALVFGMIFSVSLTPCVGAFLGSALMLAAADGGAGKGLILLLLYSFGLGIPFLLSALLLDRLKNAFDRIRRNYAVISTVCGIFLLLVGIAMTLGIPNKFLFIVL